MSSEPRVLGVVAARGGSMGLPRKNVLDVGGKPMIAWSIAAATAARRLARTVVSTDDEEIAHAARAWGGDVPFRRPAVLATAEASVVDAVLHAADMVQGNFTHVVLLQASSPLRTAADIDGTIDLCLERRAPACVTVMALAKGPEWMFEIDEDGILRPFLNGPRPARRQDLPRRTVVPNGAVYVAELQWLRAHKDFYSPQTIAYLMPADRSADVDDAHDLAVVRSILQPA